MTLAATRRKVFRGSAGWAGAAWKAGAAAEGGAGPGSETEGIPVRAGPMKPAQGPPKIRRNTREASQNGVRQKASPRGKVSLPKQPRRKKVHRRGEGDKVPHGKNRFLPRPKSPTPHTETPPPRPRPQARPTCPAPRPPPGSLQPRRPNHRQPPDLAPNPPSFLFGRSVKYRDREWRLDPREWRW